jgi:hypothetical protein
MGVILNSTPLKTILTGRHLLVVCMVPPGEFTKRGSFMASMGTLCILIKMFEIKVCEAPESKRMVAGVE